MTAAAIGDWREDALCSFYDPELWYPGVGRTTADGDMAIRICERCPVRRQCLADALSHGIEGQFGIWAGTTARQRRRMLRRKLVPSVGLGRRLRALAVLGWSPAEIAAHIGQHSRPVSSRRLSYLRTGSAAEVTPSLADAIHDAYDLLSARRCVALNAPLTRRNAEAQDWASPEDWEGVDIDDPSATPKPRPLAA